MSATILFHVGEREGRRRRTDQLRGRQGRGRTPALGIYAGLILRDTKPADLPVLQVTKIELKSIFVAAAAGHHVP